MSNYDFSGWATRNDLLCGDGRTIRRDAFKEDDGKTVALVWNHQHDGPDNVLGHALLENRDEGVYAYCTFNDTKPGQQAKAIVQHGDIRSLSIYANKLKHIGRDVIHGCIRELSLVHAGSNPGAYIDEVLAHGDGEESGLIINFDESALIICHSDEAKQDKKEDAKMPKNKEKTAKDVLDELTEEQQSVVYTLIGMALEEGKVAHSDFEGGDDEMKHNVFENEQEMHNEGFLSHSDQAKILDMAKRNNVGSLKTAIEMFAEENGALAHGIDEIESLFPEYKDVKPGAPELIQRDQTWVGAVMNGVHKSPISRIRTRQADITGATLRAHGYDKKNGKAKTVSGNIKLLKRTTDPQTVYRKDALHRDDIIDINDFDVVDYQYRVMKQNLEEELAIAFMIGDGRDDGDENKIAQEHIRSIFLDDDLYAIHHDVDVAAAKAELQGSNTSANFGDNYIYAEAIVTAALYSREQYKGSGGLEFYCTPHLLNVMLLARDLNGRRIYDSKADLAAALNVEAIHTAEQFEGKTRTDNEGNTKKLLGIFVNLKDYQVGSTKGGELTKFSDFDIDFNQFKYLIETRLSGALTRVKSAIVLEEPITE